MLMFLSFFVSLFVFCLNHHGIPTGRLYEIFIMMQLDLTEIKIVYLLVSLFIVLIILGYLMQNKFKRFRKDRS